MENVNVLLQLAKKRAGLHAMEGTGSKILFPLAIAVGVVLVFLFSFGHSEQASGLVILFGAIVLSIPIKAGITYFFARKNPKLIHKELEEIARDEEMLLAKHEEELAKDVELLHLQQEDIEICVRQQVQEEKDVELRGLEERLSALREGLANASPEDRLASQEFFLTMQQELRELEFLMEELKLDDRADLREALVEETSKNYAFSCEKIIEPRAAASRLKITQSRQVLAEVRQLIAEL